MMRNTLTILAALLLFLACSSATEQAETAVTKWNENDLKGKVKSVTTYLHYNNRLTKSTEQFGESNRLMEAIYYTDSEAIDRRVSYSYNDNGEPTIKRTISRGRIIAEKEDTTVIVYTYNDKGLNTKIEEMHDNTAFSVIEKEYNERGLLVHTIEGDHGSEITYSYDENNRLSKVERLYDRMVYEYDSSGKLTSCKTYENGSNKLLMTETLEYDDNGRLAKESNRDAEGSSTLDFDRAMRYDDKNRMVEMKITDANGSLERHVTYTYDEKDNMVEQMVYVGRSSATETSTYTYDEQGNWIEAQYNMDGAKASVTREIEYY